MRPGPRPFAFVLLIAVLAVRTAAAQAPEPAPSPSPSPEATPAPPAPPPPEVPVAAAPAGSSKVFNPDIAVVGDFLAAAGKNDSEFATPSLEMHESELSLQAVVDPYARADFFLTFGPDEVGVEEGYITFTSLPAGLLLKAGKMRASFGKVNQMHNHILPWTDRPLVFQDLVGGEEGISDAGLSLGRLFPNRFLFLEAIAEVYRGQSPDLFRAPERGDLTFVGRLRGYRDLTEATNLDFGGSFARGTTLDAVPGLHTRLIGADLTLRYRPLRRAIYRRLAARTEVVWSHRDLPSTTFLGAASDANGETTASAFGGYASLDYQFARRWFAGVRLDRSERATDASLVDKGASAVLTYWPSEFSQVRGQYRHTAYAGGINADELLFQLLFSIGAHGAHTF
jgi:hypothetical protein